jgi:enoyl-CoA hydratase/carnithine racemase
VDTAAGYKQDHGMSEKVTLEVVDSVAIITNANADKHNAFDDEMDLRLFEILAELDERDDVRAAIWRGEGKSWSSGRDVAAIGGQQVDLTHHELMTRGQRGILRLFELDFPVIVAIQGWAIGGSFQRALLCDIRIAADDARFMLPEVGHGVIPDTGGVVRLYQMCGHGLVSDLVLTGRPMEVAEAYQHGIVSRVVPRDSLDDVAIEMAEKIAAAPIATVKLARSVIGHLAEAEVRRSMQDELIGQTYLSRSHDLVEFRAARTEGRSPKFTGS